MTKCFDPIFYSDGRGQLLVLDSHFCLRKGSRKAAAGFNAPAAKLSFCMRKQFPEAAAQKIEAASSSLRGCHRGSCRHHKHKELSEAAAAAASILQRKEGKITTNFGQVAVRINTESCALFSLSAPAESSARPRVSVLRRRAGTALNTRRSLAPAIHIQNGRQPRDILLVHECAPLQ
jgi:hypothetical protein